MIKDIITTTCDKSSASLKFEIIEDGEPKEKRKNVFLSLTGKPESGIKHTKARFRQSKEDFNIIVVELKLPDNVDTEYFKEKYKTQAERMEKLYKIGVYGLCVVPSKWKLVKTQGLQK